MNLHLTDKVIIVTGGAKGIGEAIVRLLVEEGAIPVIVDKDEQASRKILSEFPGKVYFVQTDLISSLACKKAVNEILSHYDRINGLVNNAGFNDGIGLEKGTPEKFIQSMNNNAGHFYFMAHYALPQLKVSKGSIVNIGSKTSVTGQGNTSGYVAAKGAILGLTREWAVELLPYSIRVNAVIPAEVHTPLYDSWISSFAKPEEKLKSVTSKIPLEHRLTTPKEIASIVAFLLSNQSSHTTGQWIHVDGGYTHLDRAIS
ncbi:MAG: SDR family oxidoreductase [Bacteroidota bacterium]